MKRKAWSLTLAATLAAGVLAGTPAMAETGVKAAPGQPVVPSGPFTLRAAGATPYLSAAKDGTIVASDAPSMTALAVTAEDRGDGTVSPTNFNFWGYNQSYDIGYYEYFQFAEDLGAEPLPVLSVGVNGCGENRPLTDQAKLDQWVQDTLDLIEFANGPADSQWGARRAAMGHPEPLHLKYIGLGNEEIYPQFFTNYPKFSDAIRAKYPDIKILWNSGQTSQGSWFDRMWQFARDQKANLVDEHYYNSPSWFLANNHRYDTYDRSGPHVFVGEYASQGNTYWNALTEAPSSPGIERNSDVVELASYAPLLANVDYVNWTPDLIWFNNNQVYGSPRTARTSSRPRGSGGRDGPGHRIRWRGDPGEGTLNPGGQGIEEGRSPGPPLMSDNSDSRRGIHRSRSSHTGRTSVGTLSRCRFALLTAE